MGNMHGSPQGWGNGLDGEERVVRVGEELGGCTEWVRVEMVRKVKYNFFKFGKG